MTFKHRIQTMKKILASLIAMILIGSYNSFVIAQDDYDDDIYFNAKKAKTEKKDKVVNATTMSSVTTADYPAADTYVITGNGVNIDIDTYNRRGVFANDTISANSSSRVENTQSFECTQQIERFYNPRVIIESPDESVAQIYYATPATDIDIYIGSPYCGVSYPYYSSPWYWSTPRSWWYYNSWVYNPWYWDYYPSWYWGYSYYYPTYYPYYPGYYPRYYPTYYPYYPSYYPSTPKRPGSNYRPGGYHGGSTGNYRPSNRPGDYRPGGSSHNSNYRPGRGTNRSSSSSGSYRSGSSSNKDNNSYRPSENSNNRGNSYRPSSGNSSRSESTPSYRSGSSRGSSGGFRGGGGGSTRGGGGGGRGRR